ncbi:TetR/AcrR family transcriptional regulator [Actinokineospora sp. HUAS TT18]|uniref:TetR/AcrR family transcriptional regulator n=1 Tax=Actinokineospora sp. HUAS TT18 TaxID=3447451 RepID=UPI003F51EABD
MAATEGRRRSDAARSGLTRDRILRAAVDSLIEDGYAATSLGAVQARAGVSRGALLHQYPNKANLLVDAVRHLSDQQMDDIVETAPDDDWLAVLWRSFATPLFGAVLELWVAARTDPELRAALLVHQRELHANIRAVVLAHLGSAPADFDQVFEMTLTYYRGLALTDILSTHRHDRLLADWRAVVNPG